MKRRSARIRDAQKTMRRMQNISDIAEFHARDLERMVANSRREIAAAEAGLKEIDDLTGRAGPTDSWLALRQTLTETLTTLRQMERDCLRPTRREFCEDPTSRSAHFGRRRQLHPSAFTTPHCTLAVERSELVL